METWLQDRHCIECLKFLAIEPKVRVRFRALPATVVAAATVNYRPVLSSEIVPHNNNPQLSKENSKENKNKNWSRVSNVGLTSGHTGLLTIGHKITLTLILTWVADKPSVWGFSWVSPLLRDMNKATWPCRFGGGGSQIWDSETWSWVLRD
jgi:hypothetical protein